MARPKAFDPQEALLSAITVFREHGFEGTKTENLVGAMGIGRQSLYDSFGDKWQLYLKALHRYLEDRVQGQLEVLRGRPRAIDGITELIEAVVADGAIGCLGIGAICEFGRTKSDITAVSDRTAGTLRRALTEKIIEAQASGDIAQALVPAEAALFVVMTLVGLKVAARGGASKSQLRSMARVALRSLR